MIKTSMQHLPSPKMTSWPRAAASEGTMELMSDGFPWPRVSIVTPSYNQDQFIEQTIRSVLLQDYPNLEYIVIDGGSTDKSVEIILKYASQLSYWVSENDKGLGEAINKGFALATGELAGWLNSDDIYFPGAIKAVVTHWVKSGRPNSIVAGTQLRGNSSLSEIKRSQQYPFTVEHLIEKNILEQPATFFPLRLFRKIGGIDVRYRMALDYDLWLRMTREGASLLHTGSDLAITRTHPLTKSAKYRRRSAYEALQAVWRNYKVLPDYWVKRLITALVVPKGLKFGPTRKVLSLIRIILYMITRTILRWLQLTKFQIK